MLMKDLSLKPIHIEIPNSKEQPQLARVMSQLEADLRENFQRIQSLCKNLLDLDVESSDATPDGYLETTYTTNSYVTEEAFGRLFAWKEGNLVQITVNLNIASLPTQSDFVEIGRIALPADKAFPMSVIQTLSGQTDADVNVTLQITNSGIVKLYNGFSSAATGWYRAVVTAILIPVS